ncbi:MAG: restriction endonuclease subunit S [Methanosphaera sp.]|uniref:restriction endonuclease subunit S n=1 Tax=Methanosphaera sp. TaxID=2666342 RepID=UPI002A8178E9|nr:restriction endonuclease subunit S [Methanosphaera sp.]MDY3956499.1 restriction endonuclease subunit S [Methanosphaera sp.]
MKFNYEKLGNLIEISEKKNSDLTVDNLVGMNINKEFIPSVANTNGTNLARYKLITKNQFGCNLMHVGRDKSVVVSKYSEENPSIISPSYKIFQVKDTDLILPDFLMLCFLRSEVDRFCWFYTDSSVRGSLDWSKFCEIDIPLPDLDTQQKIVDIYQFFSDRIELKKKINKNLEEIVENHFKEKYIKNKPQVYTKTTLNTIITITSGKRPLVKDNLKTKEMNIPLIGASSIMGYTNQYLFKEKILITGRVGTHGIIQRFDSKCWPSDNTLIIKSKWYEYVYQILKTINYTKLNRGSNQPLITQSDLKNIEIILPSEKELQEFENWAKSIMQKVDENKKENSKLSNLRDILLPKLMDGEIDVSNIEI